MISKEQLIEVISSAKKHIEFLGVVAIDAEWEDLAGQWARKIKENPEFKITVLCESDNMLFSKSFTYDTEVATSRRTFQDMKFVRDRAFHLKKWLFEAGKFEGNDWEAQVNVEVMHLQIPVSIIRADEKIFASLWLHELPPGFERITPKHPWHGLLDSYINSYFSDTLGRKYSCVPRDEVLELYDHSRIPRGIYPRSSFYDTDYSQLVVWALIFDRRGRLLIHRRSDNAKDNRSMWDKSVGGHIDVKKDLDTSRAALREVIEELFSDEGGHRKEELTTWEVSNEDIIFLGEWRPDQRDRHPFREIQSFTREWAFFRVSNNVQPPLYSPRTLPNQQIRRLRVIQDVFLFVAGPGITDDSLGELKNSTFKLIELSTLKNVMDKAMRKEPVPGFDNKLEVPLFSPDLTNIMTGPLRDTLEEFAQFINRYLK